MYSLLPLNIFVPTSLVEAIPLFRSTYVRLYSICYCRFHTYPLVFNWTDGSGLPYWQCTCTFWISNTSHNFILLFPLILPDDLLNLYLLLIVIELWPESVSAHGYTLQSYIWFQNVSTSFASVSSPIVIFEQSICFYHLKFIRNYYSFSFPIHTVNLPLYSLPL